jgi:hypothetical protein
MTKPTSTESEDFLKSDAVRPTTNHNPFKNTAQARYELARKIGTLEHAALVAAVMRNFPEIYDQMTQDAKNGERPR